jgi:hypothetical protein
MEVGTNKMMAGAKLEKIREIGGKTDWFQLVFPGEHTLEEIILMGMRGISILEHDYGIYRARNCTLYVAPIDEHGDNLTVLPNGLLIAKHRLIINSPYPCAADHYRA